MQPGTNCAVVVAAGTSTHARVPGIGATVSPGLASMVTTTTKPSLRSLVVAHDQIRLAVA